MIRSCHITCKFAPLVYIVTGALVAKAAPLLPFTMGNIIVSNNAFSDQLQDIFEYTPTGTRVQQIPVTPATYRGRDLILDRNGRIQLYNGTFPSMLTQYDPITGAFSSMSFPGWSTASNLTYGGIAEFGRYIFVSDMLTANVGAPQGVVRFDLDGGPTVRFAEDLQPQDLYVGLDGLLYTLNSTDIQVDVFNPQTMEHLRTVLLPDRQRGIAVDFNGDIYTAQRENVNRVDHYSPQGVLLDFLDDPGVGRFADIDINRQGQILIASHAGTILVTSTKLDSITFFPTRTARGNFAAWVESPIPEPASYGLSLLAVAVTCFYGRAHMVGGPYCRFRRHP